MVEGRGLFITFEGIDGSGKTTQIRKLRQMLESESIPFEVIREPGGTMIGEKIRSILLDKEHSNMSPETELLLYEAARAQIVFERIRPALLAGKTVICDRFYDSTVAYQGYARGLSLEAIDLVNKIATSGLEPDLTFLMDMSAKDAASRVDGRKKDSDRLESEGLIFMEKVRVGYLALSKNNNRMIYLNAAAPINEVWQQIEKKVREVLNK
jgi:dTMP kinase